MATALAHQYKREKGRTVWVTLYQKATATTAAKTRRVQRLLGASFQRRTAATQTPAHTLIERMRMMALATSPAPQSVRNGSFLFMNRSQRAGIQSSTNAACKLAFTKVPGASTMPTLESRATWEIAAPA